jgi:hypothetical protein
VGPQAAGLSATTITRLLTAWQDEHKDWSRRSLADKQYVYVWAVVRHLHLVDCAYACLALLGMDAQRAQGREKNKTVLRLPTIRQLKAELRQAVWNQAVKDVVKVSHERPVIRRLEKILAA